MVEFRVLGPLEVVKDGVTSRCNGRGFALLALLLLHANEVVSSDRIIDALWGDDPPQNAANAVQTTVSRLRKQLVDGDEAVAEMIRTRPPGYVIQLAPDDLDLARFERLVQQGRAALQAAVQKPRQLLRDALATWRGPALADVNTRGLLQRERERLDEERLTTLELRIDADLACGRRTLSSANSRRSSPRTRIANGSAASSCSLSTAPGARPKRSPPTRRAAAAGR